MALKAQHIGSIEIGDDLIEVIVNRVVEKIIKTQSGTKGGYLPISQFARKYGLSTRVLYNYHKNGDLTIMKFNGKSFIDENEITNKMKPKKSENNRKNH